MTPEQEDAAFAALKNYKRQQKKTQEMPTPKGKKSSNRMTEQERSDKT